MAELGHGSGSPGAAEHVGAVSQGEVVRVVQQCLAGGGDYRRSVCRYRLGAAGGAIPSARKPLIGTGIRLPSSPGSRDAGSPEFWVFHLFQVIKIHRSAAIRRA